MEIIYLGKEWCKLHKKCPVPNVYFMAELWRITDYNFVAERDF